MKRDYHKARDWFEQGAAGGDDFAMRDLGLTYYYGQGVGQNYFKAREWFEKAVAAGDTGAMRPLGLLYHEGQGAPQDYAQARVWFERAVAAGDAAANGDLGLMYVKGQGVPSDFAKAREWYEKGAGVGDATAMHNLAGLYEYGHGVPPDFAKARQWYEKAAAAGDETAGRRIAIGEARVEGRYADALRLEEDAARAAEADETNDQGKLGQGTATALVNVSWYAIFAHEFPRALAAAEQANFLDPNNLLVEIEHAHALMFLDRTEEARALYLSHNDEPTHDSGNKTWRQVISADFAELRKAGLVKPLMEEIEAASRPVSVVKEVEYEVDRRGSDDKQVEYEVNRAGSDYENFDLAQPDPALCQASCNGEAQCKAWTFVKEGFQGPKARCWLKNVVPPATPSTCCASGFKEVEYEIDRAGSDYKSVDLAQPDPSLCQASCNGEAQCKAWTFVKEGFQGPKARCWPRTWSRLRRQASAVRRASRRSNMRSTARGRITRVSTLPSPTHRSVRRAAMERRSARRGLL